VLGDLREEQDHDGRTRAHPDAIVGHAPLKPQEVLGISDDAYSARRSYALNSELSAASFRKIYENG
jgi:hypothetical protein